MTSIIQYAKDNPHVVAPVAFTATTLVLAARANGFATMERTNAVHVATNVHGSITAYEAFCSRVAIKTSNWIKIIWKVRDQAEKYFSSSLDRNDPQILKKCSELLVPAANKQKWISIGLAALSAAAIVGSYFLLKPESK